MRGHRDLELAAAAAIGCALLSLLLPIDWLSLMFAAPLALFLPGYAITAMAFAQAPLERPQLMVLSLGLSLATLAIGGLALNYVPGGLRAGSWAALLVLAVLAPAREAALRRSRRASSRRPAWKLPRISALSAFLTSGGLMAATVAIVLAFTTVGAKNAIGYTELWVEPLQAQREAAVRIGVGSNEQERVRYRLEVRFENGPERTTPPFSLGPGETRVVRYGVPQEAERSPLRVVVSLFRSDRPTLPYRRVSAWAPSVAGSR